MPATVPASLVISEEYMDFSHTWAARMAAALPFAAAVALAHSASEPPRADPANPQAAVPAVSYRSPLTDYRRIGDQPVGNWRTLNDQVRAIGGWRAYAREASTPDGADAARAVPAPNDAALVRSPQPAKSGAQGGHSDHPKER